MHKQSTGGIIARKKNPIKINSKMIFLIIALLAVVSVAYIINAGNLILNAGNLITAEFSTRIDPMKEKPVSVFSSPELIHQSDILSPIVSVYTKKKPSSFSLYVNGKEFPTDDSIIECNDFEDGPGYCIVPMLFTLDKSGLNSIMIEAEVDGSTFTESRQIYNDDKPPEISAKELSENRDYYIISGHMSDDYGISEIIHCTELMPDGSGKSLNVQTSFAGGDFEIKIPKPEASSPENILCGTFDEAGNLMEFTSGLRTFEEFKKYRMELLSGLPDKKGSAPPPGKMSGGGDDCDIKINNIIVPHGTLNNQGNVGYKKRRNEFVLNEYALDAGQILDDKISGDNGYCDVVIDYPYTVNEIDELYITGNTYPHKGETPFYIEEANGEDYLVYEASSTNDVLLIEWLNDKLGDNPPDDSFPVLLVDKIKDKNGFAAQCPYTDIWICGLIVLNMHTIEMDIAKPTYIPLFRSLNKHVLSHEILHQYVIGHSQEPDHLMHTTHSILSDKFDIPENQACVFASHWGDKGFDWGLGGTYMNIYNPGVFTSLKGSGIGPEGFECGDVMVNYLSPDRELTEGGFFVSWVNYPEGYIKKHCIDCSVKPLPEVSVNMLADYYGENTDEPCQCYESDHCFLSTPNFPQCGGSCPDGSSCGTDVVEGSEICRCKPNCEGQLSGCGTDYWCPSGSKCTSTIYEGCECTYCDPVNNPSDNCVTHMDCVAGELCIACECIPLWLLKGPSHGQGSYVGECGDGVINQGEECEGDDDCGDDEYCTDSCNCEPLCGNGKLDPNEQCDEDDDDCESGEECILPGNPKECTCKKMKCTDPKPPTGNSACVDRKPCPLAECVENGGKCTCCGNDKKENEEECDGEDIVGLENCQNKLQDPDPECDDNCKCIDPEEVEEI